MIESIALKKLKLNPNNPRLIKDDKFKKLVKSLQDFPEMLKLRPIVVDNDLTILGGNMRFKACQEIGRLFLFWTIYAFASG
jgi:ParB-like chromosome segregation protein Spo0J